MKSRLLALAPLLLSLAVPARAVFVKIESPLGISVQMDSATGHYEIGAKKQAWTFGGGLGQAADQETSGQGTDLLGGYQELHFTWTKGGRFEGSFRIYDNRPVVLASITSLDKADLLPLVLPDFTTFPAGLHPFSYKDINFAPPSFTLEKNGTPWLLFDDSGNAVIFSAAANFMTASMVGDGVHDLGCGLNEGVHSLPAGFTHRAILTFGQGINATWDMWGEALTTMGAKYRPSNDADIGLKYLGYWTDNGAFYYYHYDPNLGYAGTLQKLIQHYKDSGIPIRYLQLDSWWYYKSLTGPKGEALKSKVPSLPEGEWNRYGGLMKYEAHPAVFPDGLAAFQKAVGLPLITHNRWIDLKSPYREQFKISGYAAVDPRWWDQIMGYIASSGVVCYEQDWLDNMYQHSPELQTVPGVGEAFTDNMARAAKEKGMSLQYCMPLPRYFLQGAKYDNLTTIRTSGDRFKKARWYPFLYTSRLAGAVGIWPWTDVFNSTETENLLMATLSGGMVGIGDEMGRESANGLRRVIRSDGTVIKPDVPLYPTDEMYYIDANRGKAPMVAWTYTQHTAQKTGYVYTYAREEGATDVQFTPSELGFAGEIMVLNMTTQEAWRGPADERFLGTMGGDGVGYFVVVPMGPTGLAFFGDSKTFVTNGRKRIEAIDSIPGGVSVKVAFAIGENSVRLFGYSRREPVIRPKSGSAGEVTFSAQTGRFAFEVRPSAEFTKESPGDDTVRHATVEIFAPPSLPKRK